MRDTDKQGKLDLLCEIEGENELSLLERATMDSVAAAICMEVGCDYVCEMEPDQDAGYCEACQKNSVVSCLILAGVI